MFFFVGLSMTKRSGLSLKLAHFHSLHPESLPPSFRHKYIHRPNLFNDFVTTYIVCFLTHNLLFYEKYFIYKIMAFWGFITTT